MIRKIRIWDRLVSGSIIEEFGHKEVETTPTTKTAPEADTLATLFDDVRDAPRDVPAMPLSEGVAIPEWNTLLEEVRRIKDEKHFPWAHPRIRTVLYG